MSFCTIYLSTDQKRCSILRTPATPEPVPGFTIIATYETTGCGFSNKAVRHKKRIMEQLGIPTRKFTKNPKRDRTVYDLELYLIDGVMRQLRPSKTRKRRAIFIETP